MKTRGPERKGPLRPEPTRLKAAGPKRARSAAVSPWDDVLDERRVLYRDVMLSEVGRGAISNSAFEFSREQGALSHFPPRPNACGETGIHFANKGLGEHRAITHPKIKTRQDAVKWVAQGGSLDEVPHLFWQHAVQANSGPQAIDPKTRFLEVSHQSGSVAETQIYVLRNGKGEATHHGYVFKAHKASTNVRELIGWCYLHQLGMVSGGAVCSGKGKHDYQFVVLPHVFKDIPEEFEILPGGLANFDRAEIEKAHLGSGLKGRMGNWLASYVLAESDRHRDNAFARRVRKPDGEAVLHVAPIDFAFSGQDDSENPLEFLKRSMDEELPADVRRLYREAPDDSQRARLRTEIRSILDHVVERTAAVVGIEEALFVEQALKNMQPADRAEGADMARNLYHVMRARLESLQGHRSAILSELGVDA